MAEEETQAQQMIQQPAMGQGGGDMDTALSETGRKESSETKSTDDKADTPTTNNQGRQLATTTGDLLDGSADVVSGNASEGEVSGTSNLQHRTTGSADQSTPTATELARLAAGGVGRGERDLPSNGRQVKDEESNLEQPEASGLNRTAGDADVESPRPQLGASDELGDGAKAVKDEPEAPGHPFPTEEESQDETQFPTDKEFPNSPQVGIPPKVRSITDYKKPASVGNSEKKGGGRTAKARLDQPPHLDYCEWRAANKRRDGELSWRLLAVIEWFDPHQNEKRKKTQHVAWLSARSWQIMQREKDYERRKKLCKNELGGKALAARVSLEAFRDEDLRLSAARNAGDRGELAG